MLSTAITAISILLLVAAIFVSQRVRKPTTPSSMSTPMNESAPSAASSPLAVGDRIKVYWPAMHEWYPGTIKAIALQDGAQISRIRYDDKQSEWRALGDARWERLAPARRPARAATSPMRAASPPSSPPSTPTRDKVWLSSAFKPSAHFRTQGFELHENILDDAAMASLRGAPMGLTRPINGEPARRMRPLDAENAAHRAVLRCLDAFMSPRGLLASEVYRMAEIELCCCCHRRRRRRRCCRRRDLTWLDLLKPPPPPPPPPLLFLPPLLLP